MSEFVYTQDGLVHMSADIGGRERGSGDLDRRPYLKTLMTHTGQTSEQVAERIRNGESPMDIMLSGGVGEKHNCLSCRTEIAGVKASLSMSIEDIKISDVLRGKAYARP